VVTLANLNVAVLVIVPHVLVPQVIVPLASQVTLYQETIALKNKLAMFLIVRHALRELTEHFAKYVKQLTMLHLMENAMKNVQHISMVHNPHHQLANLVHKIVPHVMLLEFVIIVTMDAQHKIVNVERRLKNLEKYKILSFNQNF